MSIFRALSKYSFLRAKMAQPPRKKSARTPMAYRCNWNYMPNWLTF